MPLKPDIGAAGGQQYPVLKSIQTFLEQMAGGGALTAPTVIKEILQNADDARASKLVVILDERKSPADLPSDYADLLGPALLVRNNAEFYRCDECRRDRKDCDHERRDDFQAIRDVAAGHKRAQATAAGRFGIGFNSVYFLTDTPLLFSRREVHVFDLLHKVFEKNGWQFSLDDFPRDAPTNAGPIKSVLQWCFPKIALEDGSFDDLANDPAGDYRQTVFRLPLRRTPPGRPSIYDDRFPNAEHRLRILREMVEESARSILFLNHITSISFSVLREQGAEAFAHVEASPPPADFAQFLRDVQDQDRHEGAGLAKQLLEQHPREYLALFPRAEVDTENQPREGLTAFLCREFARGPWVLRLPDLWDEPFDLLMGDEASTLAIEMIPERLAEYRDRFHHLSSDQRRFVRRALGDALLARTGRASSLKILRPSEDVALAVLRHDDPPEPSDISGLLRDLTKADWVADVFEGCWAFATPSGRLLRYSAQTRYVLDDAQREHQALVALRALSLPFECVEWVRPDVGLALLASDLRPRLENVTDPTELTALDLLARLPAANAHDQLAQPGAIKPIVDFLIGEPWSRIPAAARLGFLIRTAHDKESRRERGVILLRPSTPTRADEALWEVWFRRQFAEVDPGFAREVNPLLEAHPNSLAMLHATYCQVAVGNMEHALDVLHLVRLRAPAVFDLLETEINAEGEQRGDAAMRIVSGLLEIADARWDRLDAEQRHTVLDLPIHRTPDGRFIRLLPACDGDASLVRTVFRLQSDDDIEDAPIRVHTCQLLQSASPAARHFYRARLRLDPLGRVAVLKDVLRQAGGADEPANGRMLQYVAAHYEDTLRRLAATGDEADQADAKDLRGLFSTARIVPCVDGEWRPATECIGAWRVAERLTKQGWPQNRIISVIADLFSGDNVIRPEEVIQRAVQRLHRLQEHEPGTIAERAITSDGTHLSLKDRAKLLTDNWPDRPDTAISPSAVAGQLDVPVLDGRAPLASAELLDGQATFPDVILHALAPKAVDVRALATELGLDEERVRHVLAAFHTPQCTAQQLDSALAGSSPRSGPCWHMRTGCRCCGRSQIAVLPADCASRQSPSTPSSLPHAPLNGDSQPEFCSPSGPKLNRHTWHPCASRR